MTGGHFSPKGSSAHIDFTLFTETLITRNSRIHFLTTGRLRPSAREGGKLVAHILFTCMACVFDL